MSPSNKQRFNTFIYLNMHTLLIHPPLEYLLAIEYNHWLQYRRLSPSISYKICKQLMVDVKFEMEKYKKNVQIIDKFIGTWAHFQREQIGSSKSQGSNKLCKQSQFQIQMYLCGIEWLNSIIFNVIAINDEYKEQISHSFSLSSHHSSSNPEVSIELVDNLQQNWSQSIYHLLHMPTLTDIIAQICPFSQHSKLSPVAHKNLHELEYTLLTTISYMSQKMHVNLLNKGEIEDKTQMLIQCYCQCCHNEINPKTRTTINSLLFGQLQSVYSIKKFEEAFGKNYNAELHNACSIIDANYYIYENVRPLFEGTKITGAQFVQHSIKLMVNTFDKNDLFSESMAENDRIFQLFLALLEYRHLEVYAHWNYAIINIFQILQSQFKNKNISANIEKTKQTEIRKISNFFRTLPIQHQQLVQVLKWIYIELAKKKYSNSSSIEIIKKLLLNRFILNPSLYYKYIDPNFNVEEAELAFIFNNLRLLFYPKKISNSKEQLIFNVTQAQQLQSILASIITDNHSGGQSSSSKKEKTNQYQKCVVYQLDRSLNKDYTNLYSDIFQLYASDSSSHPNQKGRDSSYQLSFSFVKNMSREGKQVYASKQIKNNQYVTQTPQQNKSLNTIVEQLQSNKNIREFGSPTSQKSRKTVHTEISDGVKQDEQLKMIEQLVGRRRVLGFGIQRINEKKENRRRQREKLNYFFINVCNSFERVRRQIEINCRRVEIDIQLL